MSIGARRPGGPPGGPTGGPGGGGQRSLLDGGGGTPGGGSGAPGANSGGVIKDATTATFVKEVVEGSKQALVLVDFWAPWCGPCKQLTPILEKVVRSYSGKVRLVKVNIDENQAIAAQMRVQSIPMVYAFRDGRPLDVFQGAQPENAVKAFIDRLLGEEAAGDIADVLAQAEQAFEAGDLQNAAEIYAAVLQEDRQNLQALSGLAKCYLKSGDVARAEQTIALAPPDKRDSAPIAGVRAAIDLAKQAGQAGNLGELRAKVAANPADHRARIDLAVALAAGGDNAGAVSELLESIRRDRKWEEEAARKQLVKLFEAWGPKDPATLDGRRQLSSILFS